MKSILLFLIIVFTLWGCYKNPNDHDIRVIAKRFIREELAAPSTARFAPDNEIRIVREEGNKAFYISLYTDTPNASGVIARKKWDLHLLYKGGSLSKTKNWDVIK